MLAQEIIRIKRDGGALSQARIAEFIAGVTDGSVTVSDIGADLARRLVVAGLATPAPAPSRLDGS